MDYVMTSAQLAEKAAWIAGNCKTLYVMGCFGAPMTEANKQRYIAHNAYNKQAFRAGLIRAADQETFGFDCVCLIKGILWGWSGDKTAVYGGAKYAANGVPDVDADGMIGLCRAVSADFSALETGEALWMDGHIGVYIGGGLAVECTPKWTGGVQVTAVENLGPKAGFNGRRWLRHGKLPWVDYGPSTPKTLTEETAQAQALCWATETGLLPEKAAMTPDTPVTLGQLLEILYRMSNKA